MKLLFLWHLHQPIYKDYTTGAYAMPWVYLHATKDYAEMAHLVGRHERVRVTFNFTPCLLESLADYAEGKARDPLWESLEREPHEWSYKERSALVPQLFNANVHRSILPQPRYRELFNAYQRGIDFTHEELGDLQVLFHLAWVGESFHREDQVVRALVEKGRDFTREDRIQLRTRLSDVIRSIRPLYADLARAGRIEISVTPYYHPILPLLINSEVASQSATGQVGPETPFSCVMDAQVQASSAIGMLKEVFGITPQGVWPAEGSVSEETLRLLIAQGVQWAATDETILLRSLDMSALHAHKGSGQGSSDLIHRPWRFSSSEGNLTLFFRDHGLSDLIGFVYQNWDTGRAVEDFLGRLQQLQNSNPNAVVSIILDGENAWEHYPANGFDFLDQLYGRLESTPWIEMTSFAKAASEVVPTASLDRLHPGSWIGGDFRTWIGDEEKNRAWTYLTRARKAVAERVRDEDLFATHEVGDPSGSGETKMDLPLLRRSLLAAEGSDWFWWFGEPNSSAQDALFDELFRMHLRNVYRASNLEPPSYLEVPIATREKVERRDMTAFFTPTIDGRETSYFEWLAAGTVTLRSGGAMRRSLSHMTRLMYGADHESLYLRLDLRERASRILSDYSLRLELFSATKSMSIELGKGKAHLHAACDDIVEIKVPFNELEIGYGADLELSVTLVGAQDTERFPPTGTLHLKIPEQHFETLNWMV